MFNVIKTLKEAVANPTWMVPARCSDCFVVDNMVYIGTLACVDVCVCGDNNNKQVRKKVKKPRIYSSTQLTLGSCSPLLN